MLRICRKITMRASRSPAGKSFNFLILVSEYKIKRNIVQESDISGLLNKIIYNYPFA